MKIERSAGAIIFRKEKGKKFYLILEYGAGHFDFPKGHIKRGEKTIETIKREVFEETGIKNLNFINGYKETIKYFYKKGSERVLKFVVFLLAETKTKNIRLSFEHKNYFWLSYSKAYKKLTFKSAKNLLEKAEKFLLEK